MRPVSSVTNGSPTKRAPGHSSSMIATSPWFLTDAPAEKHLRHKHDEDAVPSRPGRRSFCGREASNARVVRDSR
jgi:hypothetical protein